MIVVIAVVGGGAYFAFKGTTSSGGTTTNKVVNCQPSASPVCSTISGGHDVLLSEPIRVPQQSSLIPFTADYVGSGSVTVYNFTFGDGTFANTTNTVVQHAYQYPGTYLASVQARVGASWHDNYNRLLLVTVQPSSALSTSSEVPTVGGNIVTNGSSGGSSPSAVLAPNGQLTVKGSYVAAPSDAAAVPVQPTLSASAGGTLSGVSSTATTVTGTATFASPGTYWVVMNGGATVSGTTYTQNYVWTVFVAAGGTHANYVLAGAGSSSVTGPGGTTKVYTSPHKGTLDIYEYTGSAASSLDPSISYDTVSYEPVLNVYQALIAYNQSQTGPTYTSYVPQLATCVPGAPQCQSQWGASFTGIGANGNGENFTFVIDSKARFYDPATKASWPVYPSDVVFSLARTMAFSTLPCIGCNNGWIETQALLGTGSGTWDGGTHAVFNNTPGPVFASMGVNDSNCPAAAMTSANGCVTFHANANNLPWPYFLELIADQEGSSIEPCGWFSAQSQGSGIPLWTNGTEGSGDAGDHPCKLPGGATSTTDAAYAAAVAAMNPKGWDSWEVAGAGTPYLGDTQTNMVGSGPYYMANYQVGSSYFLKANPAYQQPTGCTWTAGCEPAVGKYAGNVSVIWEITSPTPGEQAADAGTADLASFPVTDLSHLLKLVNSGSVGLASAPTLSIYFWPFDMNFNVAAEQSNLIPQVNVPGDWFSHGGMRQFFVHAYPYATTLSTIGTKSGISFYQNYGGAIPHGMANFYGGNISWPAGDPNGSASTPGTAAWWWAQVSTNNGNPYYDSETSGCSSSTPCIVGMIGQTAAPDLDQRITDWGNSINKISGGAIQLAQTDIPFSQLVAYSTGSTPGTNPMPVFQLGWAPDYPDPTDYIGPLYQANGTYGNGDSLYQSLTVSSFMSASCHDWNDFGYWANLASTTGIPDNCQGAAYHALQVAMAVAAVDLNNAQRVVQYWQAEAIANGLALYVYWGQQIHVPDFAAWIDGNSLNNNVTIGGGSDNLWYAVNGNGVF